MLQELDNAAMLPVGSKLQLEYKYIGPDWTVWKAAQAAIVEASVGNQAALNVTAVRFDDEQDGKLIIFATVQPVNNMGQRYEQASVVSAAVIILAATAIAGGIAWLMLDKIYQIVETPAGKAMSYGWLIFIVVAGLVVVTNLKAIRKMAGT